MLKEKEAIVKRTIILLDGLIVFVAFLLAYLLRKNIHLFYAWDLFPGRNLLEPAIAPLKDYLFVIICVVPLWCFLLYFNGMYESLRRRKFPEILWIILKTSFFIGLIFGSLVFVFKLAYVSRILFAIFMTLSFGFILVEKTLIYFTIQSLRRRGFNTQTLLIVGTGSRALNFINKIKSHPEWGFKILGVIDDEPGRGILKVDSVNVIGAIYDIPDILKNNSVDEVIFMVPRSRLNHMQTAIFECETVGISTAIAVDLFDLQIAKAHVSEIDGIPMVRHKTVLAKDGGLFIKRLMDLIVSGAALIFLLPFFILTAITIKVTSRGPVFFKQERLGLNGRKFILYKFRTMRQGADSEWDNGEDIDSKHGAEFKKKKKQWITPFGRLMRKFSLDELPQLINVLVGQMSLIGPRPTVLDEVTQYKDWQRRRFSMKPGLTCLWQISGRNKLSHQEWMELDLEYLDNWSLWLDFKILIKTIPVVLFGIGAY